MIQPALHRPSSRIALLVAALVGSACVAPPCDAQAQATAEENATSPSKEKKVLRHAVFFKFKDSSSDDEVAKVVEAFRALPGKIEEIRGFQIGENISRIGFSDGLTHCFLLSFDDEAGRDAFLPHPDHSAFGSIVGPHLDKVFVIDYWAQDATERDTDSDKPLQHAAFFKFKEDASDAEIRTVEEKLAALPEKIEAIKGFEWGTNNSPEKHDQGFTHCFLFTFDSEEGLREYAAHEAHTAVVNDLRPLVEEFRVIDFRAEDVPTAEAK